MADNNEETDKFCELSQDSLQLALESVVQRNASSRKKLADMHLTEKSTQDQILQVLRLEISGPIICALDTLNPQLTRLVIVECRNTETLETWISMRGLLVDYKALFKVIKDNFDMWDSSNVYAYSPELLEELIEVQSKLEDQFLIKSRMVKLRIGHLEKIRPHLGALWPKIAEAAAVNDYIQLIKFQIGCLKQTTKIFEAEIKKLEKLEKSNANNFLKLQKIDKFGEQTLFSCWRKKRPLTASNLHIWHYTPAPLRTSFQVEVLSQKSGELSEETEKDVAKRSIIQVWNFVADYNWRLPGQMIRLVHHLKDVEQRLLETQCKLDNLELVEQQMKKVRNEKNLLQHELARNRKFLTQILLEKLVNDNQTLKQFRMNARYPQCEDPVVQELVQKNVALEQQVQVLEEVVKYSREEASKHKERSRSITNSMNNAINSLEQIAVMFILHERTDQQLIFKLKSVVQNERLQGLVGMLNKDDLNVLQDSLQKGNVDQVLSDLMDDLDDQQTAFRNLLQKLGPEGLTSAIRSLPSAQLTALAEAIADERLDATTELLRSAKPEVERVDENPADQVAKIVEQLQQLLSRME